LARACREAGPRQVRICPLTWRLVGDHAAWMAWVTVSGRQLALRWAWAMLVCPRHPYPTHQRKRLDPSDKLNSHDPHLGHGRVAHPRFWHESIELAGQQSTGTAGQQVISPVPSGGGSSSCQYFTNCSGLSYPSEAVTLSTASSSPRCRRPLTVHLDQRPRHDHRQGHPPAEPQHQTTSDTAH
jgi:hypothetical protein